MLVPRLSDTVMAILFEEVARACASVRFAIVATTGDDPDAERTAAQTLLGRRVDGLILTTARLDDDFTAQLRADEVPHVLALRTDGVSPSSIGDDELGGYLATRHLSTSATETSAWCRARTTPPAPSDRARAPQGHDEAGIPVDDTLIRRLHVRHGVRREHRAEPCSANRAPTAVFAVNDNTAIGVLAAAQSLGLRSPTTSRSSDTTTSPSPHDCPSR